MVFKRNKQQKPSIALGLDLGTSVIKAAVVKRTNGHLELCQFATHPLPARVGKPGTERELAEHLQQLLNEMSVSDRKACVAISCSSAMVCHTEFPRMPLDEIKNALKLNSARFLRRDLSNYYLDAAELVDPANDAKSSPKVRVLVGGASKEDVVKYRDALLAAKIRPEVMELAAVSVVNALLACKPELCEKEAVLLIDIGAHSTSINFLQHGQPVMTRIMHFGGHQLSEYLGQTLSLEFDAAEEEKRKMSEPVRALIKTAISPLAREVRSSIDFFERQHECHVGAALACGGSVITPQVPEFLSEQVGMHIECWNPVAEFDTSHFNGDGKKLAELAPSLAVAIGVAAARL
jgi:type IV pilus assembly protein PilM